MSEKALYDVTEIQRFCMHDGPGIRTTVFLKGCPLRCAWCHNPETQETKQQLLYERVRCISCGACVGVCPNGAQRFLNGFHNWDASKCVACLSCVEVCPAGSFRPAYTSLTADEVVAEVLKDKPFFGATGGVTLSGGEPLFHGNKAVELLQTFRDQGISTAVETSGLFDRELLPHLVPLVDTFLWDFKDGNDERHKRYTGVSNQPIHHNLFSADSLGAKTVLRCILVEGVNTEEGHYRAIANTFHSLSHCAYVELIPYHAYGGSKMELLGEKDNGRREWIPGAETVERAKAFLRSLGVKLKDE